MGMTVFLLVAIIGTLFGVPMVVGWMIGPCVRLCIKTHTVWAGFAVLAVWCLLVLGGMVPVSGLVLQYDLLIRMECVEWA